MDRYFYDKANIYKYQKDGDILLMRPKVAEFILKKDGQNIKSKVIITKKNDVPKNWKIKLLGDHNMENVALAISAAMELGVDEKIIKKIVENFSGVPGRLQFIAESKGIKFYNDTTATTPDGTIAAMDSLKKYKGKIVLIGGGADKNLDYKEYARIIPKYIKALILFSGAASEKIISEFKKTKLPISVVGGMKEAMRQAIAGAKRGDVILLSPGAASFGIFKNEFDRGDQFDRWVRSNLDLLKGK